LRRLGRRRRLPLRTLSDHATSDTVHLRRVLVRRLVLEMLSLFRCENSEVDIPAVERVDFFFSIARQR
jgi:hypothetical protein